MNTLKATVICLLWAIVLVVGWRLQATPEMRSAASRADVLEMLFGEARTVFSKQLFERADVYYHGGVMVSDCEHGLTENAVAGHEPLAALSTDEHVHDEHAEHEHHEHEHNGSDAAEPSDWLSRINRERIPSEHRHLAGYNAEKELVPWLWASVRADPHNVLAAEVAAYWLAQRLGHVPEAIKLLREAITANPAAPELDYMLGSLLYQRLSETAAGLDVLEAARQKWEAAQRRAEAGGREAAATPPDPMLYYRILRRIGDIYEDQGKIDRALEVYRQALPYAEDPQPLQHHIQSLLPGNRGAASSPE